MSYFHQRLLDPLLILQAYWQVVAPRTPFPGPFIEAPCGDPMGDVVGLGEELREILS